jgi:uncharacterized membrane protein YqiK
MEKAIALYQKSLEESAASAEADVARARTAEAEEKVKTVRETEAANRRKSIDVTDGREGRRGSQARRRGRKGQAAPSRPRRRSLLNEAENVLTDPGASSLFRRKLLEHVEGIVSASVKPLEKIQDIRIMQLDGVTGGGGHGGGYDGSPTDEVINSALRYRVQAPLIDSLLADIGIDGATLQTGRADPRSLRHATHRQRDRQCSRRVKG